MKVKVIKEAGHNEALLGMALSYWDGSDSLDTWWNKERQTKAFDRSKKLAFMQGGHNKYLESIVVWFEIKATRAFWQEFDTYRIGITKQSASTMHTLKKRKLTTEDFGDNTYFSVISSFNSLLDETDNINILKDNLPEGFLQTRIVCTNYKVLQNIVYQRKTHRYKAWRDFVAQLLEQLEHPYYIENKEVKDQSKLE
jgi:hypothetical protein